MILPRFDWSINARPWLLRVKNLSLRGSSAYDKGGYHAYASLSICSVVPLERVEYQPHPCNIIVPNPVEDIDDSLQRDLE